MKDALKQQVTFPDWWTRLECEFLEIAQTLRGINFEPAPAPNLKDERRHARDTAFYEGALLIPYRATDDRDEVESYYVAALEIAAEIKPLIAARQSTAHLIQRWGALQFAYGIVTHDFYAGRPDPRLTRAGADSRQRHAAQYERRWIAREILFLTSSGMTRTEAEMRLDQAIVEATKVNGSATGKYKEWLEGLLAKDKTRLKSTYRGKKFSLRSMEALKEAGYGDLPAPLLAVPTP